jgi:transposase
MKEKLRFLGLDVHAETIAVAIAEPDGEVQNLGTIPNRLESIRKLIKKLGPTEKLRACYEAGPTGYVVYWQLAELGVKCDVVAPTLVPVKAGDRVKTDRRPTNITLSPRLLVIAEQELSSDGLGAESRRINGQPGI